MAASEPGRPRSSRSASQTYSALFLETSSLDTVDTDDGGGRRRRGLKPADL